MGVEVGSQTGRSKKLLVLGARSGSGQNTETQTFAYQAGEIMFGLCTRLASGKGPRPGKHPSRLETTEECRGLPGAGPPRSPSF